MIFRKVTNAAANYCGIFYIARSSVQWGPGLILPLAGGDARRAEGVSYLLYRFSYLYHFHLSSFLLLGRVGF